ncbi:MAG: hypothetical protein VB858_02205, partial [Planctomycetaceae bacterium]
MTHILLVESGPPAGSPDSVVRIPRPAAGTLRAAGFQVTLADSLAGAVREIQAARMDLIITDLKFEDGS